MGVKVLVEPGTFVMPGESILMEVGQQPVCIGPGLVRSVRGTFVSDRVGIFRQRGALSFYIDAFQDEYVPKRGEYVLGTVRAQLGDVFCVDIGSSFDAHVSLLAFENATRRNRPNVKAGDVIFGRLIMTVSDTEPDMVCIDAHGKRAGMGLLEEGHLFEVSLHHCRRLLHPSCNLFQLLGAKLNYEVAVGMNGRVWIKSPCVHNILAVKDAIRRLEENPTADVAHVVKSSLRWRKDALLACPEPVDRVEDEKETETQPESVNVEGKDGNERGAETHGARGPGRYMVPMSRDRDRDRDMETLPSIKLFPRNRGRGMNKRF